MVSPTDLGRCVTVDAVCRYSYDYYLEAIAWREQQKMPTVGISIDRRTIKHLSIGLKSCPPTSLVCACCQCQYTCLDGVNSEMARINAGMYFGWISASSFKFNWCLEEYMKRYGHTPAMENHKDLGEMSNFQRLLRHPDFDRQRIICCAEDIVCCHKHSRREVRECCSLPLCSRCFLLYSRI